MWGFTRRSCRVQGEPYTSRGVRTVRGRASGNPSPPGDLGAGCLAYDQKGRNVDDEIFDALNLTRHTFHRERNYAVWPQPKS